MSIALDNKVGALEKRVSELETKWMGMTKIELLAHLAQLELRIERIEQRAKPGPKPRDGSNG
ncbi:MAG TPA: hypothetical protein VJQ59_13745 [Candidatus Sulfotelmatobacter sp.]|uniref:hypothetical protein n=1 Tax=Trinickia sp. TaxID=2571163 RepID=UPI002BA058AB|nr:hypothetical protein [Candidatus Sulfotelmatobacter sp.]